MRSWCFVFPFAGFVKQSPVRCFKAAKTLGTIEDFGSSCTRISDIVKLSRRTIARPVWQSIYLGGWFTRDGLAAKLTCRKRRCYGDSLPHTLRRHPEVLAASGGEPRRIGRKHKRRSCETPRKARGPSG
jgi:hypothetical protein